MARMLGKQQLNNLITMHFHKLMHRGMATVQLERIPQDMLITKHKQLPLHTTRDNKDISRTHDNLVTLLITCIVPTLCNIVN